MTTKRSARALLIGSLVALSMAASAASAAAKGPPSIQDFRTRVAALRPHSAELTTSVYTQWEEQELAGFQYGLTTAYGSESPIQIVKSNFLEVAEPIFATIEGLSPGTTYHYQAGALNNFGSVLGADHKFTTPPMPKFNAAKYPATLADAGFYGSPLGMILEGFEVTCLAGSLGGQLSGASPTVSLEATFSECRAFGFLNGKVSMNGCTYVFHAGEVPVNGIGELDLVCPEGKAIEIEGGNCRVSVPPQSGIAPVTVGNMESEPQSVHLQAKGVSLEYTKVKDGVLCPLMGTGSKSDGILYSSWIVGALDGEGAPISLSIK
jgi:hypothetical protein